MSFNVAPRETISKASYDNQFRSYPEEVRLKAARIEKHRIDSQETEAMRYERLMTQKFIVGTFVIESPRIALLAKIGKAMLIVALFPPFFIFVTFPRYTFQTLLPTIFSKLEEPVTKIVKNVQWISAWSVDIFNIALGKVARKLKITLPRIELPTIKFTLPEKLVKPILKPFKVAAKIIEKTKEALVTIKEKIAAFVKPIQKAFTAVVEKSETFFLSIESKLIQFVNYLTPAPPPMRAYGQKDPVPTWKEKLIEFKEKAETILTAIKNTLMAPVHALITRLEPAYNFVATTVPYLYNQVQTAYETLTLAIKARIDAVTNTIHTLYKKAEAAVIEITTALIEQINTFLTPYYPIPGRIAHAIAVPFVRAKASFSRKVAAVLSFGNALKEHAKSFVKYTKAQIKKIPALVNQFLKASARFGINFLKALKSLFIILGVTLKILYLYMRDLNNRVFGIS